MQDLTFPFLSPQIVAGLTGLTPRTLRRLRTHGIPPATRSRRARAPRAGPLYSWQDVEHLQRATYLLKAKRLPLPEVKQFLEQSAAASIDRDWVIARPKPHSRRRPLGGAADARSSPARRMR
ncbi:MAG TPA: MerR family transcriptional regulator [bacterium]|nr:MerR family transcriptional regulator [bacterium]